MFHFRGSIKRLCHSVSSLFFLFKWKQKDEWSLVHGTLPPSGPEKEDQWEPDREQDSDELWLSLHLSISVSDRTQTDVVGWGGVGGVGGVWVARCYPGASACCQSPTEGAPFRGGSWGFLGEEGECAADCDAWGGCHSGRGCGCHGECHRGSGRSRWPFRWVLAGRSQSALGSFQKRGRKQSDRNG